MRLNWYHIVLGLLHGVVFVGSIISADFVEKDLVEPKALP